VLIVPAILLSWSARPAHAGPITFLTALPVASSQAVVRGQYFLIRATDDPTPAERDLTVHAVPVAIAVGATPRLALFGIVPIVTKSIALTTPIGRITRETTGLGDIVTFARYTVYAVDMEESTFRIAPFGGIKMPTGDSGGSDALGVVPRPLQPGSGSWDGLGGLAVPYQTKQWELDADTGIKKNTEADDFRFGDEFFADLSFQYRVWPRQLGAGVPAFLFAVVETNVISQGRNMIVLKIVGYAEDVVRYYRLDDFKAHVWIAHQRYPTKGRVWHPGGAHPFAGLDDALVHNGDFANYFSVSEYLRQRGLYPMFLTDTEV